MPSEVYQYVVRNRNSCYIKPKPAALHPLSCIEAKYDKGYVLNLGELSWYLMASSHSLDGQLVGSLSPLVFPNKPPTIRTLAHLEKKQQIAVERKKEEERQWWGCGWEIENHSQEQITLQKHGQKMRKEREQQRKQSEGRKNENEFSDNQQEHIEHSNSDECITTIQQCYCMWETTKWNWKVWGARAATAPLRGQGESMTL